MRTCAIAPSTFSDLRSALERAAAQATFAAAPSDADDEHQSPSTSGGSSSRFPASHAMTPASTSSSAPLSWAERISARPRPKVKRPFGGRAARRAATSARPIAPASVSMCAASESSASESARMPATTSTAMNARTIASAIVSHRRSAAGETAWEWPWSWSCATATVSRAGTTALPASSTSFRPDGRSRWCNRTQRSDPVVRRLPLLLLFLSLAGALVLGQGHDASSSSAQPDPRVELRPVLDATLRAAGTVTRPCHTGSREGAAVTTITVPGPGPVEARLDAASGDWDLAIFDDAGRAIAAGAGADAHEVAAGWALKAGTLRVQACRRSGDAGDGARRRRARHDARRRSSERARAPEGQARQRRDADARPRRTA